MLGPDPANERFVADRLVLLEADDRLVEEPEFLVVERRSQPVLDVGALDHGARHAGVVEAKAALFVRLGGVKRQVRRLQELARRIGVFHRRADADARGDDDFGVAEFEGFGQFPADALGERLRLEPGEPQGLHDREFVAAKPHDEIRGPREREQAVGDALEQHVPERMPVGVVDELEPVEIDDVQREGALPLGLARKARRDARRAGGGWRDW